MHFFVNPFCQFSSDLGAMAYWNRVQIIIIFLNDSGYLVGGDIGGIKA